MGIYEEPSEPWEKIPEGRVTVPSVEGKQIRCVSPTIFLARKSPRRVSGGVGVLPTQLKLLSSPLKEVMWLKFCVRKMAYTDGSVAVLAECLPSAPESPGLY